MVRNSGLNHIDLATKDMEATRRFYEDVMGFPLVRADLVDIVGRGTMKHFFFDIGNGQLLGFMSGEAVEGFSKDYDSGINRGLTFRMAQTPVQRYMPTLLALIEEAKIDPSFVVTDRAALADGPALYQKFRGKKDSCIKRGHKRLK